MCLYGMDGAPMAPGSPAAGPQLPILEGDQSVRPWAALMAAAAPAAAPADGIGVPPMPLGPAGSAAGQLPGLGGTGPYPSAPWRQPATAAGWAFGSLGGTVAGIGGAAAPPPMAQAAPLPGPHRGSPVDPVALPPTSFTVAAAVAGVDAGVAADFVARLGGSVSTTCTDVLSVPVADLRTAADTTQVNGTAITPLAKGSLLRFVQAIAANHGLQSLDLGLAAPNTDSSVRKRKLSAVIDQAADTEVSVMAEASVRDLFNRYDDQSDGAPQPHEEPTADQLSALSETLRSDSAPYTDFGVWGPFGRRQSKLLKFSAQIFVGGELVTRMLTGPPNFTAWRACWRVFRVGMLVLGGAKAGPLDEYEERIRELSADYPGQWGLISRADDIMRSEYWERIRRRIERCDQTVRDHRAFCCQPTVGGGHSRLCSRPHLLASLRRGAGTPPGSPGRVVFGESPASGIGCSWVCGLGQCVGTTATQGTRQSAIRPQQPRRWSPPRQLGRCGTMFQLEPQLTRLQPVLHLHSQEGAPVRVVPGAASGHRSGLRYTA